MVCHSAAVRAHVQASSTASNCHPWGSAHHAANPSQPYLAQLFSKLLLRLLNQLRRLGAGEGGWRVLGGAAGGCSQGGRQGVAFGAAHLHDCVVQVALRG